MKASLRRFAINTHISATLLCGVLCSITSYGTKDIKPTSARERGFELFQQKKFEQAIETLKTAVAADKKDHEAWYYLGMSQLRNQDYKSASKSFETVLKINPQFAAARTALGLTFLYRNKTAEASREAQKAIAANPTIADAYYILGVARLRKGANLEAVENADKAIKLRPEFAPPYLLKTEALVGFIGDALAPEPTASREELNKRYGNAIEALEKYLKLAPNAPNNEFWREQLASLKLYIGEPAAGESEKTFRSSQVTTRARVLSKPEPAYTDAARAHQVSGTVILRAVFASDGTVKHLIVVRGLPDGLTEVSIAAAKRIKFVPATVNGRPVSMWMQLEYNFSFY